MTTLVATRRPLETLSMSNQQEPRSSKRLAAATNFENDDDFQFVRKSKRAKTAEQTSEPEPVKKSTKGRLAAKNRAPKENESANSGATEVATTTTKARKPTSRRKPSIEPPQDEPEPRVARKATRRSTRASQGETAEATSANGASHEPARRKPRARPIRQFVDDSPPPRGQAVESAKIALPMSDTPIINRNKEMRKKGNTNRRSSLGTRGRRASSLIESGQAAIPHREVDPAEFYKHIEAEGLMEPRRMKQLLTWCGERSLSNKPPHGNPNSSAILGARAIQDQLLKDFASRTDFSNWFGRDDDQPRKAVKLKPNPRNIELDEKIGTLEDKIKRLQGEKKAWLAIRNPPPEQPRLFPEGASQEIELPDFDLLDPEEGKIRGSLADETASFQVIRSSTESRLRNVQKSLEFQIDKLADNVHKFEQRVSVAGKEADHVLRLSALRLQNREQREKKSAGTKDMPMMEVLRSLGKILPEGG